MKKSLLLLMWCLLFCFSTVQGQNKFLKAAQAFSSYGTKVRLTTPISMKRGSFHSLKIEMVPGNVELPQQRVLKGYTARDISSSKGILGKQMLNVLPTPSVGSLGDCTDHILIANPSRNIEFSDNTITTTYSIAMDKNFPKNVDSFNLVVKMVDNFDVVIPIKVEQVEKVSKPLFKEDSIQVMCKDDFMAFLEHEQFPDSIFPKRKSSTSMSFVAFCKKWRQIGLFDPKEGYDINPYAAYRFLTIDCGLKCNPKHDIKKYSNFLRRELNRELNPEMHKKKVKGNKDNEVADWFLNKVCNQ